MTQPQPVESIFSRAWELLTRNWIIIVPGLVIGLVLGILGSLFGPHQYNPSDPASVQVGNVFARASGVIILAIAGLVAFIANQAYTVGMAGAAWTRGATTLADGAASFSEDAGRIVMTAIGLFLLAIVAAILAFFTFGLSLLAFYVFSLYAMPAAIVGNRPGFSSISESFEITKKRFVPTLIIALLIVVISIIAGFISALLSFAPLIGPIVAACLTQAVVAFATLVVVGEYLNLTAAGTVAPPSSPG